MIMPLVWCVYFKFPLCNWLIKLVALKLWIVCICGVEVGSMYFNFAISNKLFSLSMGGVKGICNVYGL